MSAALERLEELLFASTCEPFSEAERAELNSLLRDNTDARSFAAKHLTIDALLAESLAASKHGATFQPIPISTGKSISRPNWLARAAAWIGAFHLFSNTAKASTVIIMKKTVTSATVAILVIGGSGIYMVHHNNESSKARVAAMETEIQSLSGQLEIKSIRSSNRRTESAIAAGSVSINQVLAVLSKSKISMRDQLLLSRFREQLAAMDVESLKSLLLDAEKISNPIHGSLVSMVMPELISKDPAEATQLATRFIGSGAEFQFHMSHAAADAFKAWQAKDPAAADAWYVATAAAGDLYGKGIAPNGLENLAIDRSLARLRFAAQVASNPAEAATMLDTMLPADVTASLKEVTDPNALRQILPMLTPEQKVLAADGAIKAMAANDPNAAFAWAMTLDMTDQQRDTLMASGIEAAVASGKLDLSGVSEWSKELKLADDRRSQLLVSAATDVSLSPVENKNRIDSEKSVYWDRVSGHIDWLRKEAPSEFTGKAVGEYLGKLSYESHNLEKSLEAYEHEVARQGKIDQDLTINFASYLSLQKSDRSKVAALKLLKSLPQSERRDNLIDDIELNR